MMNKVPKKACKSHNGLHMYVKEQQSYKCVHMTRMPLQINAGHTIYIWLQSVTFIFNLAV